MPISHCQWIQTKWRSILELHGEQNCFEQQNNFLQDITDSHKGLHMDRQTLLLIVLVSYITKLTGLHR